MPLNGQYGTKGPGLDAAHRAPAAVARPNGMASVNRVAGASVGHQHDLADVLAGLQQRMRLMRRRSSGRSRGSVGAAACRTRNIGQRFVRSACARRPCSRRTGGKCRTDDLEALHKHTAQIDVRVGSTPWSRSTRCAHPSRPPAMFRGMYSAMPPCRGSHPCRAGPSRRALPSRSLFTIVDGGGPAPSSTQAAHLRRCPPLRRRARHTPLPTAIAVVSDAACCAMTARVTGLQLRRSITLKYP